MCHVRAINILKILICIRIRIVLLVSIVIQTKRKISFVLGIYPKSIPFIYMTFTLRFN